MGTKKLIVNLKFSRETELADIGFKTDEHFIHPFMMIIMYLLGKQLGLKNISSQVLLTYRELFILKLFLIEVLDV